MLYNQAFNINYILLDIVILNTPQLPAKNIICLLIFMIEFKGKCNNPQYIYYINLEGILELSINRKEFNCLMQLYTLE